MCPLVLIPGMMCDARMWGAVPDGLPVQVHHAIPVGADAVTDLAARLLRDLPERFALAGLSMGGIVAMAMTALAPERVLRLALLDTNPRAEAPQVQARRQPQIDRAMAGDLTGVLRDEMVPHYLATPDPVIEALCLDMARDAGPAVFRDQSIALRDRPDHQDTLRCFTGPALVLTGAEDRLCPRDRHELMHALMPQSDLVIIDGAGHVPPLERPVATTAALLRWLEA